MPRQGIVGARLRTYKVALVGLAALTALVSGAVGGTFAFIEQSSTQAVRTSPELLAGDGSVVRLTTRLAPEPAAQDDVVRGIIGEATGAAPVDVTRTLTTEARSATSSDGAPLDQVVLRTDDALDSQVAVEGVLDLAPGEVLVPESAAEPLALEVGETVTVADVDLVVAGLWAPTTPSAPSWTLDSDLATDEPPFGPVLVDEATLLEIQDDPFVSWTVTTRASTLTVDDVSTLAAGLPSVRGAMVASPAEVRGVVETGGLTATVQALDDQASTARAVTTVPVVLLLIVSVVSLVQVARLLVTVRARESQILVARGASVGQLGRVALVEALPAAVTGVVIGSAAAWAVLALVGPVEGWTTLGAGWLLLTAGAVAALVVVLFVGVATADARSIARMRAVDSSGRRRVTVGLAAMVLLGGISVLLLSRLWRARSQAVPDAEALVVAAPGVLLLALVLVVLALLAPTLRLVERRTRAGRGLSPVLPARQVSRRLVAFTVPAVLVALATGAVLLASGYSGTTDHLRSQVGGLATGSDVKVQTTARGTVTPLTTVPVVDVDGLAAASSLVLDVDGTVGDAGVRVLGIPGGQVTPLLDRTPAVDVETVSRLGASGALAGAAVPDGATKVVVSLEGQAVGLDLEYPESPFEQPALGGVPVPVTSTVWLADDRGGVVQATGEVVQVPVVEEGSAARVEADVEIEVPDTSSAWRVVALDLRVDPRRGPVGLELAVTALAAEGAGGQSPLDVGPHTWTLLDGLFGPGATFDDGTPSLAVPSGATLPAVSGSLRPSMAQVRVRFVALGPGSGAGTAEAVTPSALSAVVVPELLELLDASIGDTLDVSVAGQRVPLEVVASTPALPGGLAGPAVAVDLDALHAYGLLTSRAPVVADEVWLAAEDPSSVDELAGAVQSQVPSTWSVTSPATASAVPAASIGVAFWVAAAGAVALALAGTWSVLGALGRERRSEVVALRAVGLSAAAQARSRTVELVLVLSCSVVAGLLAGALVTNAVAGFFARVTVPEAFAGLSSALRLDPVPLVVLLVALALGVGLLMAGQARTVRAQALDLAHREDAR